MLNKILNKKNIVLYEIIAVLVIFTVIYFIVVANASHAFENNDENVVYNNKITLICKAAEKYASDNIKLFKEKTTIYVTVDELVEKGYVPVDDEEGNVNDPSSSVKTLNEVKIRLTYEDDKIEAKALNS